MKKRHLPSVADDICKPRTRKIKKQFFSQLDKIIDWTPIKTLIDDKYSPGKKSCGNPAYEGILLFSPPW